MEGAFGQVLFRTFELEMGLLSGLVRRAMLGS